MVVTQKPEVSKKKYVVLGCERGKRSINNTKISERKTNYWNQKCGHPFKLKGRFMRTIRWKLIVECDFHNHKVMATYPGHSYGSRFSSEEKSY